MCLRAVTQNDSFPIGESMRKRVPSEGAVYDGKTGYSDAAEFVS